MVKHADTHIESGCRNFLASPDADTGKANAKNAWSKVLGGNALASTSRPSSKGRAKDKETLTGNDRIPKPPYDVLKDKKIRELLSEYDLPTTGTREQMIGRHTQCASILF